MKHLQITFTDGTVEDLKSKYVAVEASQVGVLYTFGEVVHGGNKERGPTYVIRNIRKFEWVEGHK